MNEKGLRWHQATPESLCQHLHTNAACGLSRKAARSHLKKQGRNALFDNTSKREKSSLIGLLFDPAILLMLFAMLLAIIFLPFLHMLGAILIFALLIAALVRFLYRCDELSRITSQYRTPTVRVLRDGRVFTVSAARVVVGDVLLLHTGDIVPGDCRLLTSQQLRVLTLLPDEKGRPIYKEYAKTADIVYPYGSHIDAPLAENMLYGGSEIFCGEAKAILVATGTNSYLGAMHSFSLPAEIRDRRSNTHAHKNLAPYMRLWSVISLILLTLLTVIGLITTPTDGGLTEYFFILCVMIAASSPAIFSLYLHWISVKGRFSCMENTHKKNNAIIKSEDGLDKLANVTDLFVIGKRGLCDGVSHFWSAFIKNKAIFVDDEEEKSDLQPLCEAMLLRHEADTHVPTHGCASSCENDSTFLSELVSLCNYDAAALKVRLQSIKRETHPEHTSWQCITANMQDGTSRFLFDNSGTLMRHCMVYADGVRMRAITPEYRSTLRKYCEYIEENGSRVLCIAKESGEDTLVLLGVIALREQVSAVLPSVVEELLQSGVETRFFLTNDDYAHVCNLPQPYLYCNVEHPKLTFELLQSYRTFIGFSKEELSKLLPTYTKCGHQIAVLGGNADDRCFLRAGVLNIACDIVADPKHYAEDHIEEASIDDGREGSRNTSQVIRRHADVIIERADRFSGGVYAVLQAISHSRSVGVRTNLFTQFWLYSQLARVLMMLFSVLTGIGFFTSLQMLLSSFVIEAVALIFLAEVSISQQTLRHPQKFDKHFIEDVLLSKESLLPTAISVAITALVVIILTWVGVLSQALSQTYFYFSLLFLQIVFLCRLCVLSKIRPQLKKTLLCGGIFVGAIALLTLLSSLISPLGVVTGIGSWMALTALLLPLMPVLYMILTLILPFLRRTAK